MRWVAVLFGVMCIIVPVGFYIQAHGNFRGRAKLEPWAHQTYKSGVVETKRPIPVSQTQALCAEARRMMLRLDEAEKKEKAKDIQVGHDWFRMLRDTIKFTEKVEVLEAEQFYTKVRVVGGPDDGFVGYVYTVALEESAKKQPTETPASETDK